LTSGLDLRSLRRAAGIAAATFEAADFLHREIRSRALERFDFVRIDPRRILDLGAGTGESSRALADRFPQADILALDLVPEMLMVNPPALALCGAAEQLPLADSSVELVFSNLMLHWTPNIGQLLSQVSRVLKPNGLFMFATLGEGTLNELQQAWAEADPFTHVMDFIPMRHLGDKMIQSGMVEPVLDSEVITVTYDSVRSMAEDLKNTGSGNHTAGRCRGLTSRARWRRMQVAYDQQRNEDDLLTASVNVVYGHAWKQPTPPVGKKSATEFEIAVDTLRKTPMDNV